MSKQKKDDGSELIKQWPLPTSATLGSSVRGKGILLEIRSRLPLTMRKSLDLEPGLPIMSMPGRAKAEFHSASTIVSEPLRGIEAMPVIPRENPGHSENLHH